MPDGEYGLVSPAPAGSVSSSALADNESVSRIERSESTILRAGDARLAGAAQQLGHDQHAENADDDHDDHDLDESETALAATLRHAMRNVLHRVVMDVVGKAN